MDSPYPKSFADMHEALNSLMRVLPQANREVAELQAEAERLRRKALLADEIAAALKRFDPETLNAGERDWLKRYDEVLFVWASQG